MKQFALFLALAVLTQAQEFEVASVRASVPDNNRDSDTDDGRYHTHNLTLKTLVARAWDLDESEVSGGPNWTDSDGWDINAKIPAEYATKRSRDQFLQMVQKLLADRFQLVVHREQRQLSGYALIVVKSGAKMAATKATGDGSDFSSHNMHLKATNVTIDAFARWLSRNRDVGRLVVDRTGLTGKFDFELDWGRGDPSDDRPSILTALPEQLGLRLDSAKVPIQAVVIDHAEKPQDN